MSLFRFSWHSCGKFICSFVHLFIYITSERGYIFFINNIYIINIFIPSESEIGKNEQMNKWTFTHPHRHIVNFFSLPRRACKSYLPSARGACRPSPARWGAPTWCVWGVERYIFCLKPRIWYFAVQSLNLTSGCIIHCKRVKCELWKSVKTGCRNFAVHANCRTFAMSFRGARRREPTMDTRLLKNLSINPIRTPIKHYGKDFLS